MILKIVIKFCHKKISLKIDEIKRMWKEKSNFIIWELSAMHLKSIV
jgi:hypothetical protein